MAEQRLLTRAEVEETCSLTVSTIYRLMRRKLFPSPVRVGVRAVRWRTSDIQAWLDNRPEANGRAA